jgi:hypothetical protein
MLKIIITLSMVLISGCTHKTIVKEELVVDYPVPQCYAYWKDANEQLKYMMGEGKTRDQKIEQKFLLFPGNYEVIVFGKRPNSKYSVAYSIGTELRMAPKLEPKNYEEWMASQKMPDKALDEEYNLYFNMLKEPNGTSGL